MMRVNTMNMQKYRILLTVVNMGSITRAAEYLNYTQSAVSQALLSLEREWGFQLLERSRSGVALTPNAQALLPYLREIDASQTALDDIISRIGGVQTGMVRIGAITSLACHWLPHLLKEFRALYPGIQFDLRQGSYAEIAQLLDEGEIDVGFSIFGIFSSQKERELVPLGGDRMLAVVPPGHSLEQCERIPLELLGAEPFILLEEGGYNHSEVLFRAAGVKPNLYLRIHDDSTVMALVESGLGVSILSELALRRCPYRVSVRELEHTMRRELGMACRRDRKLAPAVECFHDFVKKHDLTAWITE